MPLLLAHLPHPPSRTRLDAALELAQRTERVAYQVRYAASWQQMHQLALVNTPQLVVFDPYPDDRLDCAACGAFHAAFPSVVLFAYGRWARSVAHDVLHLVQNGVRGVLEMAVDDSPAALHTRLNAALAHGVAGEVLAAIGPRSPPELARLVQVAITQPQLPLTPEAAARLCFCHPKTLRTRLRAAGLPPTHHLMVWLRLFHAAFLLRDPVRSVDSVAVALGYVSGSALTAQMTRYTGLRPGEVRGEDGILRLVSAFRARSSPESGLAA
jgi:AraC-like DNA-binding protein